MCAPYRIPPGWRVSWQKVLDALGLGRGVARADLGGFERRKGALAFCRHIALGDFVVGLRLRQPG
jgi:hypothetical protein